MISNQVILLKVRQRLNKLASNDYDNITDWRIVEAFNKATISWVRRNLHGYNHFKEGDESSKRRITDLQVLLIEKPLALKKKDGFYQADIPKDFMEWKRINAKAKSGCCDERPMMIYLSREGDTDELLRNHHRKPNFQWAETFCNLANNKVKVYTNNEFEITSGNLVYYRFPNKIEIIGVSNPYTGESSKKTVESEFKDDLVELFIDEASKIIAGDIENITANQLTDNYVETNN
ncbi:MAG: Cellulophaga phage phi4:1 [Bacteroidota bacterium]|jgi:hypothetical protein